MGKAAQPERDPGHEMATRGLSHDQPGTTAEAQPAAWHSGGAWYRWLSEHMHTGGTAGPWGGAMATCGVIGQQDQSPASLESCR